MGGSCSEKCTYGRLFEDLFFDNYWKIPSLICDYHVSTYLTINNY